MYKDTELVERSMEVKKVKTNNYWPNRIDPKTKKQHNVEALVLHMTGAGGIWSAIRWFKDPFSNASSNYIVDRDGTIYEVVPEKHAAWTNGKVVRPTWSNIDLDVNANLYTVSVEVVNNGEVPTWQQWTAWARLCREIMSRHNLTIHDVVNHYEIHGGKQCPRPWFTRFWLKQLLPYS